MLNWEGLFIYLFFKTKVLNSFQLRTLNSRFFVVKVEQARVGQGTGNNPRKQSAPAGEAFPRAVYLSSNLISLDCLDFT